MQQGSEAWLKLRKTKVTATDAPVIMGVSPWETPHERWRKKLDLDPPQPENEAMRRGKLLEPIAREQLSLQLGIELKPDIIISKNIDWAMASLDGISHDGQTLVEIKCPMNKPQHGVPEIYMPQLQHQMFVCEVTRMYYYCYMEADSFLIEVPRNDNFIEQMLEKEKEFYECLKTLTPPKLVDKDVVERTDFEWASKAFEWKIVKDKMKELEENEKELRQSLIELAQGSNCRGAGISLSRVTRPGNIIYKNVPELRGVDLEAHRGSPVEFWRVA